MISLQSTTAQNLQSLFAQMREMLAGKDASQITALPLDVPAETGSEQDIFVREALIQKVADLYIASLRAFNDTVDKGSIARVVKPTPGKHSIYLDEDDLARVVAAAKRFLNPRDPAFSQALTDKNVGLVQYLGENVDFINDFGDPPAAVKYLEFYTRDFVKDGVRMPLVQMPWADRIAVLQDRKRSMHAAGFRVKNEKVFNALQARFTAPEQKKIIDALLTSFEQTVVRLKCSDYQAAQWFNVLFTALEKKLTNMTPDAVSRLQSFIVEISSVRTRQDLAKAVDGFVKG